jgi:putative ABC transport system permease protein
VSRLNLIWQFLSEAVLSALFAGIISIFVIELVLRFVLLDWFNLTISLFDNLDYFLFILFLSILVGLLAGLFPSFSISQLNTIDLFKGNFISNRPSKFSLRDILVAFQFVFTITIIIGSIVVLRQLYFLKNKDLGFKKEYVINVSIPSNADNSTWNYFKESIRKESSIKSVGTSLYPFVGDYNTTSVIFTDKITNDTVPLRVQWNAVNYDLIPTMQMQIIDGRNFSRDIPSDSFSIIINEAAKNEIGIDNIMDQSVYFWWFGDTPGRVIGVVKDYHFQTFDQKILPTVFMLHQGIAISQNMLIRMSGYDYKETLSMLDQKWNASGIEAPFIYSFIDDWVADLVRIEERLSNMVTVLSVLTILISLLGLLGLISFTVDKKKKEISIRKVFGASIRNLIVLLNRRFLILIIIALVLSIPVAIWGTNSWLQQFAYRITLNPYDIFLSILIIILLPGGLINVKCWHAAHTNPTINLRNE